MNAEAIQLEIDRARAAYQVAAQRVRDAETALEIAITQRIEAGQEIGRAEAKLFKGAPDGT